MSEDKLSVTIFPLKGEELVNGTTYNIEFDAEDRAGNKMATVVITFSTKL